MRLDIDRTADQLSELRDLLEKLFKLATAPKSTGNPASGLAISEASLVVLNEMLSRCKKDIVALENILGQNTDPNAIKGLQSSSSSSDAGMIMGDLALITTALRGFIDRDRRYVCDFLRRSDAYNKHSDISLRVMLP